MSQHQNQNKNTRHAASASASRTLPFVRIACASSALALILAPAALQAQTKVIPLPLSGPAYELAQDAYRASARGDYQRAMAQLKEAMRLRPDAIALQTQLRQIQQQQQQQQGLRSLRSTTRDAGYNDADAAFRAYRRHDYQSAVQRAREAVRKSPDNDDYWLLLGNALIETRQYDDAERVLAQGIAITGSDDKDEAASPLQKRQAEVRRELAALQAARVFRAQSEQNPAAELDAARKAVDYAPGNMSYRLMLIIALLHNEQLDEALSASAAAQTLDPLQAGPLLLRAYTQQRLGHEEEVLAEFAAAAELARPEEQTGARLLMADSALAMRQPQRALEVLNGIDSTQLRDADQVAQLQQTRLAAQQALGRMRRTSLAAASSEKQNIQESGPRLEVRQFPVPALDCRAEGKAGSGDLQQPVAATVCHVIPGQIPRDRGYDKAVIAYQAMEQKNYQAAASNAQDAIALSPENPDYRMLLLNALLAARRLPEAEQAATAALRQGDSGAGPLLAQRGAIRDQLGKPDEARADFSDALTQGGLPLSTEIDLLARLGRQREARDKFNAGREAHAFDDLSDLELAYLASRAGEDALAQGAFRRADQAGKLPDAALEDAAFSATRNSDDRSALGYFKRSIDAANAGAIDKTPQQQFDTRRTVSTVDREWGFIASLTRSGGGPAAGSSTQAGAPGVSGGGSSLQAGAEAYWRPFGYQNGRTFEVFGRVFQTLQDKSGGGTGTQTAQATVGARWKPFTSQNVVVSFGRLIPIGSQASSDWLGQIAYSDGIGTDLRVDRPSWWTTQWYAEAGRYFQHPQTYGLASLQAGRSFRLDDISPRLVVFPHVTLNTDYNSLNSTRMATGFGPGVNLRYWFREDTYHAPRSYLELSLQYRFTISGDERARGLFMTTTLSY
ncbi:tetratricopeptide repeat protein [Herbaspirillum lusitanum]|uniref:Tetratricopeptide repeat protein n=1 Tax=Herbaspirillum lusitanum TaxID=213312 RepID=A0ABW9AD33_9BURK